MSKVKEDTAKVDNTAVVKPKVFERLRVTPRKYELVDLGGTPSNDTRTPAERNKDYLHPIKGAKERFKASMSNETNPLVGIERTILPSAAGAALVTTPIALAKGAGYGFGIDKLTGGWGNMVERTTGIPSEIAQYTNPGAIIGGAAGYRLDQKNLLSKFIKGDADLAWNPINKNHWIFNKEARTASNIGMAVTNRLAPFLQGVEKLPLKVAAYKTAKRTKGNASVTLSEIKGNPSDYAGASILGGGNLEGRNLVAQYIFGESPIIKRVFFNKATSNIKPISRNEAKRGFSHGDRYEQLYPGIYNRRYEMRSVVPQGRPLKFSSSEFAEYAGNNPVGKVIGKEGDMIMRTGDTEFIVFRNPGTNYVGGHVIKLQMDKGKLKQTSQDMWKFNPADYAKRWNESPNAPDQVRLTKQAALMDKVGTPFILQQSNPIWIEGRSVRQAMKVGGKFTFKKSPAVKDAEKLNGKRDMRKKFVKSSRPTYKRRIRKGQVGMRFVSYVPVNNPTIDYTDITNPINPFSEYYIPTTYNTEQALVVPEREDSKSDTVEETPAVASKPIAEPVVNKPVASKVVNNTANSTWSSPYKDRSKWAADLTNAYKRAGITNDNAIRMLVSQDALESAWGRSAQGKFNFGNLTTGAKWKGDYVTGNDKNAKGEAIKQKFRSYNSMDEYAADKVQFLKRLYDFDENDDINKFVAKLTGSNKGKRRYAEATNYANTLKKVYNSYRSGGIIKYQEPANGIQRRDAFEGQDNKAQRERLYRTVNPADGFNLGSKASNGWRYMWNSQRDEYGTSHDEALWKGYLDIGRDSTLLPPTNVRFSRDYDITSKPFTTKEYVGLPKQQKDAIRDKIIPRVGYKTPAGKWAQIYENPLKQFFDHPIETMIHKGDAVDTPDLSGLANFGLRNNNNSGIFDVADTYDFYTKPNQNGGRSFIPNRNKGYELEIRDTIWTKDAKPELYKVENGYLPYNTDALTKKVYNDWLKAYNQKNK